MSTSRAPDVIVRGPAPFRCGMIRDMGDAEALQNLFDARSGLVTQSELDRCGVGRGRVRHLLDSGRWQRVLRGVYAVTTGPLTREMTLDAALLYGGGAAILSHRTAAEVWGILAVDESEPVHLTVPIGRSALSQRPTVRCAGRNAPVPVPNPDAALHPGVVVHRSRAYVHIAVDGRFPCTTKADTVIDLAAAQSTARGAYASLIESVTNGNIRLLDVRRQLEARPPYRYRRALASAVALLADGVQSVLEYRYAVDVEQAHGLPPALRQGPVVVDGRTLYEDCVYDTAGFPLTVRLDGRATHAMREVAFRDRRRDNAAELAGRSRLVFGYEEVTRSPCAVAGEVATVLTRLGWVPDSAAPCGACARFR